MPLNLSISYNVFYPRRHFVPIKTERNELGDNEYRHPHLQFQCFQGLYCSGAAVAKVASDFYKKLSRRLSVEDVAGMAEVPGLAYQT